MPPGIPCSKTVNKHVPERTINDSYRRLGFYLMLLIIITATISKIVYFVKYDVLVTHKVGDDHVRIFSEVVLWF